MQTNPPCLLLDTNVWLDLFLPHRKLRDDAICLLNEAETHGAALAIPSHALLDVYQKVRSDNKRWIRSTRELTNSDALAIKRLAWDCVNEIQRIAITIPVDASDVYLACKYRDTHDDFEDDLVLAACQRAHANYLVTNDERLIAHAPIPARSPAQMVELLRTGRAQGTPIARDSLSANDWLYRWLAQQHGK